MLSNLVWLRFFSVVVVVFVVDVFCLLMSMMSGMVCY